MEIDPSVHRIAAVVLAAGQSRRMGTPKMVLPWGSTTVIAQVVDIILECDIKPVVVVTGGAQDAVQKALGNHEVVFRTNSQYATTEMLDSLRIGMNALPNTTAAMLVALGDQPQIPSWVVRAVVDRYLLGQRQIVVPSYQMRRGHPWLIGRKYWDEIIALGAEKSMRSFMAAHAEEIDYLVVDTPTILGDLDTPEDYARTRPSQP